MLIQFCLFFTQFARLRFDRVESLGIIEKKKERKKGDQRVADDHFLDLALKMAGYIQYLENQTSYIP